MKHPEIETGRLSGLPPDRDVAGVGPLIHAASAAPPALSEASRRRIRRRLDVSLARRPGVRRRWRAALLVGLGMIGGMVVAAVGARVEAWVRPRPAVAPPAASESPPAPSPAIRAVPPAPGLSPTPAPPAAVRTWRSRSAHASRSPDEAAVVADAIRRLRVLGDAQGALEALDAHFAHFPAGAFGPEVEAVRVEALLKLGRRGAALRELDHLSFGELPRSVEWQVVRGELRAGVNRWKAAEADFDQVLAQVPAGSPRAAQGDLPARALWGRAVARMQLGDTAGARADCVEYLRRFPGGRFSAQAAERISASAPPR